MPTDLKEHVRYPADLFELQSRVYRTYQMDEPQVFYNQEDLWAIPQESYTQIDVQDGALRVQNQNNSIPMEPYYITMSFPEEDRDSSFVLMRPYTPEGRNNLISWLGAKSDPENYGELVLYRFSKQELIYGPMQIEARIDQEADISQQLSLWDQRGSEVIRGNLLVIPLGNSLLYIEPIFLQAKQGGMPELRRVIASNGDKIVMKSSLDLALWSLFDLDPAAEEVSPEELIDKSNLDPNQVTPDLQQVSSELSQIYAQIQAALQEGNWEKYGKLLNQLDEKMKELNKELDH
jgi:uncharacterized membrane protein (UPF0182 family)